MLVFGCCVGPSDRFERIAAPALGLAMGPDDQLMREAGDEGIAAAYNRILAKARLIKECEGVVLLHDDVELGPGGRDAILAALRDTDVGVVGVVGGKDLWGGQWFKARAKAGYANDSTGRRDFGGLDTDVDVVDGLLLALAPRAYACIDFTTVGLPDFHGYDTDYCLKTRAAGLRVRVTGVDYVHHDKGRVGNEVTFNAAQDYLWETWHPRWIRNATPRERWREERRDGYPTLRALRRRWTRRIRSAVRRVIS